MTMDLSFHPNERVNADAVCFVQAIQPTHIFRHPAMPADHAEAEHVRHGFAEGREEEASTPDESRVVEGMYGGTYIDQDGRSTSPLYGSDEGVMEGDEQAAIYALLDYFKTQLKAGATMVKGQNWAIQGDSKLIFLQMLTDVSKW